MTHGQVYVGVPYGISRDRILLDICEATELKTGIGYWSPVFDKNGNIVDNSAFVQKRPCGNYVDPRLEEACHCVITNVSPIVVGLGDTSLDTSTAEGVINVAKLQVEQGLISPEVFAVIEPILASATGTSGGVLVSSGVEISSAIAAATQQVASTLPTSPEGLVISPETVQALEQQPAFDFSSLFVPVEEQVQDPTRAFNIFPTGFGTVGIIIIFALLFFVMRGKGRKK